MEVLSATRKLARNGVRGDHPGGRTKYGPHFSQADFWTGIISCYSTTIAE